MDMSHQLLDGVSVDRIRDHIQALEGVRHPLAAPEALERSAHYIRLTLQSLGYEMTEHPFSEDGRHGTSLRRAAAPVTPNNG